MCGRKESRMDGFSLRHVLFFIVLFVCILAMHSLVL
jgi:hypothetical protein